MSNGVPTLPPPGATVVNGMAPTYGRQAAQSLITFQHVVSGGAMVPIQLTYQGKPLDPSTLAIGTVVQFNPQTGEVISIK